VLTFIDQHRALVLRHSRTIVRAQGDKTAVEDVACEMELVLEQMVEKGLDPQKVSSPDQFLRAIARHALGRAKRRRRLIEQLAAGEDLPALSLDPSTEGTEARTTLERLKEALPPRDALVAALLFEDDATMDEVAQALSIPMEELATTRERVIHKAASLGIIPEAPGDNRRAP
jgi:DNA-directed RNA polymerase specialized sigma24 family protein